MWFFFLLTPIIVFPLLTCDFIPVGLLVVFFLWIPHGICVQWIWWSRSFINSRKFQYFSSEIAFFLFFLFCLVAEASISLFLCDAFWIISPALWSSSLLLSKLATHGIFVATSRILSLSCFKLRQVTHSCGVQDLVPRPEIRPALAPQNLSHGTTREDPALQAIFKSVF